MGAARPILLATWSFGLRAGRRAWASLLRGGAALDAVELACIDAEDDPGIDSVGYGGLPDRDGEVSLDACVMCSPRRIGSVCALRSTRRAASVARAVMERTPHALLAGTGADAFALSEGFAATSTLAPEAAEAWRRWRTAPHVVDQSRDGANRAPRAESPPPRPVDDPGGGRLFDSSRLPRPEPEPEFTPPPADEARFRHHDTIGCLAIDASAELAGACSTSGTPFKRPGRVGDSPIPGHGLYVDPAVGAATATGTGELVMGVCGSFLAVESLRSGRSPLEAVEIALRRILESGPVEPHHQVGLIVLARDGRWAAGSLRPGYRTACFESQSATAAGHGADQAPASDGVAVDAQLVLL
ncbi:MAG TPA: N(4)-(beta-N-acetylglucosaminyl)-L-asparaginase [Phycisphaerales bacterium]|nr:N(4)-(beta-N-acetylglucosaminyl)-L-asparaginase [Phycisphaerales bacterium]HMP36104.1 N(4)-(beta-N-acetylglucosaminyl)-L-asparaginase [Phycisphaerales bacterium]